MRRAGVLEVESRLTLPSNDRPSTGIDRGFELEALHVGGADVVGAQAGCLQRPIRRTRTLAEDDVVVLVEERGTVQAHAAVEQVGLEAHFVGGERFRLERQTLVGHERPRIDAAALEAGRDRRVGEELHREKR